jgi:hypothetical protein
VQPGMVLVPSEAQMRDTGPLFPLIYNRLLRCDPLGAVNKIFAAQADKASEPPRLTIDAIHRKAPRTAARP